MVQEAFLITVNVLSKELGCNSLKEAIVITTIEMT